MRNKFLLTSTVASSAALTLAHRAYAAGCDLTTGVQAGANCAQGTTTGKSLPEQIGTVTDTLLLALGIIAVIMIIIGGLRYVLSGGNQDATRGAKDTILYAVIGLVVALLSYAIVNFAINQFK